MNTPSPSRTSRTVPDRWLPALAGVLAVFSVLATSASPGVFWGEFLLGTGTADTWGHAWGYGWAADALSSGRLPFYGAPVDHPGDQRWWIIDFPVAVFLTPWTALFGSGASYNLAMVLHLGVGAGALAALCRRRGGTAAISVAVGVLAAHSPFVRGVITSGIPEALGVLVAPLLVLWLDDALRTGRWRSLVGAVITACILVLDGVYGALAGALAAAAATRRRRAGSPALESMTVLDNRSRGVRVSQPFKGLVSAASGGATYKRYEKAFARAPFDLRVILSGKPINKPLWHQDLYQPWVHELIRGGEEISRTPKNMPILENGPEF